MKTEDCGLLPILALLHIIIEDISEGLPTDFRDEDAVPEVALNLRDGHVPSLLVPLDVEVEVLILYPQMPILRSLKLGVFD